MPTASARRAAALVAAAVAVLAAGCSDDPRPIEAAGPPSPPAETATVDPAPSESPEPEPQPSRPEITMVLAVSVDGLAPQSLVQLTPELAPTFWQLVDDGTSTLDARTEVEQTVTLPNHTGMLTGRRIAADEGGHGWTVNVDNGGEVVDEAGTPIPSVFDVVHEAGLSSALFTAKDKFAVFNRTWPVIDSFVVDTDNERLTESAIGDLRAERRAFTFLHLSLPDVVGHASGWMSPLYLRAVADVDVLLGTIVDAIDETPYLRRHLVLVVTADHGGEGTNHSDAADPDDYTVPFLVRGPGVPAGVDIYDLNDERRDPGTTRPGYGAPRQPVRNGDVANLATQLLGLTPVPGSQFGVSDPLQVVR